MNPLAMLLLPVIAVGVVLESIAWILGARYRGPRVRISWRMSWILLAVVLAYAVLRNVPVWPLSWLAPG